METDALNLNLVYFMFNRIDSTETLGNNSYLALISNPRINLSRTRTARQMSFSFYRPRALFVG